MEAGPSTKSKSDLYEKIEDVIALFPVQYRFGLRLMFKMDREISEDMTILRTIYPPRTEREDQFHHATLKYVNESNKDIIHFVHSFHGEYRKRLCHHFATKGIPIEKLARGFDLLFFMAFCQPRNLPHPLFRISKMTQEEVTELIISYHKELIDLGTDGFVFTDEFHHWQMYHSLAPNDITEEHCFECGICRKKTE